MMTFGIPLLHDRVSPRSTFAETILIARVSRGKIAHYEKIPLEGHTVIDLVKVLKDYQVDTLICGGISQQTRESVQNLDVSIIDNVAGKSSQILEALRCGTIHRGYGISDYKSSRMDFDEADLAHYETPDRGDSESESELSDDFGGKRVGIFCLACQNRICLQGEECHLSSLCGKNRGTDKERKILEAAADVAFEEERKLCRLAELVYFALEMKYQKIGIAFCVDLWEPAEVLAGVLRRFFDVYPVCCKIIATSQNNFKDEKSEENETLDMDPTPCNPEGQAKILNSIGTDLNVIVGLCMGADCVFTQRSQAPVTTLFVKDKSLANNPIGAIYSDRYLKEITSPSSYRDEFRGIFSENLAHKKQI